MTTNSTRSRPEDAEPATSPGRPGDGGGSRSKRLLRAAGLNAGLLLASLCLAGLAAEVAIRLAAPQQLILIRPDLWQPADTVGWLHRPNVDIRINTGERNVRVITDSAGFRVGPEPSTGEGPEVLLLGDSFVEALQVDHSESGAALLEAFLSRSIGTAVHVRNAGIGGWGPSQYARRAESLLAQNDFDLVITAVFLGNDIVPSTTAYIPPRVPVERFRFRLPRAVSRREITDAILRPVNDFMEVRSHVYIFVRNRLQTLRMQLGLAPIDFPPHFLVSNRDVPDWAATADLLSQIDSAASRAGAPTLFVLIPAPFQVDSVSLASYVSGFGLDPAAVALRQPNERLEQELERRGLAAFDPLSAFQDAQARGRRLYGTVDPHFTPDGNRLFAELLTPIAAAALAEGDRGRLSLSPEPNQDRVAPPGGR